MDVLDVHGGCCTLLSAHIANLRADVIEVYLRDFIFVLFTACICWHRVYTWRGVKHERLLFHLYLLPWFELVLIWLVRFYGVSAARWQAFRVLLEMLRGYWLLRVILYTVLPLVPIDLLNCLLYSGDVYHGLLVRVNRGSGACISLLLQGWWTLGYFVYLLELFVTNRDHLLGLLLHIVVVVLGSHVVLLGRDSSHILL